MECPHCGEDTAPGVSVCLSCGHGLVGKKEEPKRTETKTFSLGKKLAILFGGFFLLVLLAEPATKLLVFLKLQHPQVHSAVLVIAINLSFILVPVLLWLFFRDTTAYVCDHCGTTGKSISKNRGSLLIEIILWCCFVLPGLIYSIWRRTSEAKLCRVCGHPSLVPADSPLGTNLINRTTQ